MTNTTNAGTRSARRQHGMALVAALLLLLVITLLGVGMFRSYGLEQHIGGNTRDKARAFQAASADLSFAEQWLTQNNGINATAGSPCTTGKLDGNNGGTQVCSNAIQSDVWNVPWPNRVAYTPPSMNTDTSTNSVYGNYSVTPSFYISFLSSTPPAAGIYSSVYQIDAVGYGASATSVAVVESTYSVQHYKTSKGAPTGGQQPLRNVDQGGT